MKQVGAILHDESRGSTVPMKASGWLNVSDSSALHFTHMPSLQMMRHTFRDRSVKSPCRPEFFAPYFPCGKRDLIVVGTVFLSLFNSYKGVEIVVDNQYGLGTG
eukprot:scaffold39287_cov19-Prasinocladus_malaysianus.AAC.1